MKHAFVLGNGRSRLEIDSARLKDLGVVYGCNAIYRDMMPNYLIAVDSKMVIELVENEIQTQTSVWTNYNKRYQTFKGLHYLSPSKGWSSGPTALWLASVNAMNTDIREIYILGFDYKGVDNKYFNNVYADTKNYKKSQEPATFFGNWLRQTESVFTEFSKINYYRVTGSEKIDFDWGKFSNYKSIDYTEFKKRVNY
jgi:hypothetical protein